MAKPTQVEGLGPQTPVSKAGFELLSARLSDVRQYEGKIKGRPARKVVHDMRVATRRLRAAVHLFGNQKLRRYERQVKVLQDALGEVRDTQLQLQWLRSHARGRRPALRPITHELQRKLLTSARGLRGRVSQWRNETAPAFSKALGSVRSRGRLGGKRMRRHLSKKLTQVIPRLEAFNDSTDPTAIHGLRIALKKLRYDVELLEAAFPAYAGHALSVLAPLQGELGSVHDEDVWLELLTRLAARASKRSQPEIEALLGELLESRQAEVKQLSERIAWLVSHRIPDRLRTLLQ
jgi:CHAD domain-containing protein